MDGEGVDVRSLSRGGIGTEIVVRTTAERTVEHRYIIGRLGIDHTERFTGTLDRDAIHREICFHLDTTGQFDDRLRSFSCTDRKCDGRLDRRLGVGAVC